jgi:hypothetical protein
LAATLSDCRRWVLSVEREEYHGGDGSYEKKPALHAFFRVRESYEATTNSRRDFALGARAVFAGYPSLPVRQGYRQIAFVEAG